MESEDRLPLRWVHFREGPEGAGVYVHVADLLYLAEARSPDAALNELVTLLEARSDTEIAGGRSGVTG